MTALHSTDGKLLNLSGSDIVFGLRIESPRPASGRQSLFNSGQP